MHCEKTSSFDVEVATDPIPVEDIEIEESPVARKALKAYFRRVAYDLNPARRWAIRRAARILPPTILNVAAKLRGRG